MEIINFTPIQSLVGGFIIGLGTSLFLLGIGRVFGISGIVSGLLNSHEKWSQKYLRIQVILGLMFGASFTHWIFNTNEVTNFRSYPYLIVGPMIMGFGTLYGSGCTSGHGVCGISRFSKRSIIATMTFIFTGAATVLLMRLLGLN